MLNRTRLLWLLMIFMFSIGGFSQSLSVEIKNSETEYYTGDVINVNLQLDDFISNNPSFLHSWVDNTGYRKLKLGNNTNSYYSPTIDLLAGGNNEVQICMRVKDENTNWSKNAF